MQKEALTLCDIGGQLGTMDIINCAVVYLCVSHLAMYRKYVEGNSPQEEFNFSYIENLVVVLWKHNNC